MICQVLKGILGVLVIFYGFDGQIVFVFLILLIQWLVGVGIYNLMVVGNIGEFFLLLMDEICRVYVIIVEVVVGWMLISVVVGCLLVEVKVFVCDVIVVGCGVIMSYYLMDFFVSFVVQVDYFLVLVDVLIVLVIVYVWIDIFVVDDFCCFGVYENIVGVKYVLSNLMLLVDVICLIEDLDMIWVCGLVEVWVLVFYVIGVQGFILGFVNVFFEVLLVVYVVFV